MAKLAKIKFILSVIVVAGILFTSVQNAFALFSAETVVSLTNQQRAVAGLPALVNNQLLANAAYAKATDMMNKGYFAHNSPEGKTPWDFIHEAGYNYTYAGENLALSYYDANELMTDWMNSPSHRDNILNTNFREIGVAVISGSYGGGPETTIVVQEFGTSPTSPAPGPVQTPTPTPAKSGSQTSTKTAPKPQPTATPVPSIAILTEKSNIKPQTAFTGEDITLTVVLTGSPNKLEAQMGSLKFNLLEVTPTEQNGEKTFVKKVRFEKEGTYTVTVSALNSAGRESTISLGNLQIKPAVLANSTANPADEGLFAHYSSKAVIGIFIFAGFILGMSAYLIVRHVKFNKLANNLTSWEF